MKDLAGKGALVTGGGNGIGRGIALALAEEGVNVLIADLEGDAAREVAQTILDVGGTAQGIACDVGSDDCFTTLRSTMMREFGGAHIIVNNAATILSGLPQEIPPEEWQRVLNINLMSVVRSNAAFLPGLIEQGEGHIVNTASFAGLYGYAFDRLPYAASKAAVIALSEGLAIYLKPQGIGVTLLCPGPVQTTIMSRSKVWSDGLDIRGPGPQFALMQANEVGRQVVAAICEDRYFLPTHAEVRDVLVTRAADISAHVARQISEPHLVLAARAKTQ